MLTSTGGSHLCDVQYLLAHILTYEGEGARRIVLGHRTCIDKRMLKLQQFLLLMMNTRASSAIIKPKSKPRLVIKVISRVGLLATP